MGVGRGGGVPEFGQELFKPSPRFAGSGLGTWPSGFQCLSKVSLPWRISAWSRLSGYGDRNAVCLGTTVYDFKLYSSVEFEQT